MGKRLEHPITQIPRLMLIATKQDLAKAVGVPAELLERRAYTKHKHLLYERRDFRKRDGSVRQISTPHWPLMNIQRKLVGLLEEIYTPSSRATGFIKMRGVKYNASLHLGKRLILNIDLKSFFSSVHFGRIRGRLMSRPYVLTNDIATTIASLCTLDGHLPIGAPTSPILANIVASHLDGELTSLAREHGCFYSRYADDITFSTNRRSLPKALVFFDDKEQKYVVGSTLSGTIQKTGFEINPRKTRLLDKGSSQEITGIVINRFPNVRREFLRNLRAALNAWEKYGRSAADREFKKRYNWRGADSLETNLRGRLEHLIHVRGPDDLLVWKLVQRFNALQDRQFSNISYERPQDERARLVGAVCRIESGHDEKMEFRQGSGIKLPNGLILTNHHNVDIEGEIAPDIEVFLTEDKQFSIRARVVRVDASKDVALLEPVDDEWRSAIISSSTELSFSAVQIGEQVKIAGFPSYILNDSCQLSNAEAVAFSTLEGIRYFRIDKMIVKGNSGGPIFNTDGQVIGIASRGIDTHEITNAAFNGCLELFRIEKFLRG